MRIMLAGDPHIDTGYIRHIFQTAKEMDCDKIVLLGDNGLYWPGCESFMVSVENYITDYDIDVYAIDGNHDNHDKLQHDANDFVEMDHRFWYIPRGFTWAWDELTFLGIGGADSIDKDARVPFVSWWPNEEINNDQALRACRVGKVDIVLSHDVPWKIKPPNTHHHSPSNTRYYLDSILYATRPSKWFHGHHHIQYFDSMDGCDFRGLDCNFNTSKAWYILDTDRT